MKALSTIRKRAEDDGGWLLLKELGLHPQIRNSAVWLIAIPILSKGWIMLEEYCRSNNYNYLPPDIPLTLHILYGAAIAFFLGNLIYVIFCPKIFKEEDYQRNN